MVCVGGLWEGLALAEVIIEGLYGPPEEEEAERPLWLPWETTARRRSAARKKAVPGPDELTPDLELPGSRTMTNAFLLVKLPSVVIHGGLMD